MFSFFRQPRRYREGVSKIHQIGLSCNPLPPVAYGGIETIITNLTKGLVNKGVPVVCYAPPPFGIDGASYCATLDRAVQGPREGVFVANVEEHLSSIMHALKNNWNPYDIVHLHHSEQYLYLQSKLTQTRLQKMAMLETAHWTTVGLQKNIVYPSDALHRLINRPGSVIPHGIDVSRFQPASGQKEYLFYSGRITRDKGVHIGVAAAADYGVEFRVAGPVVDAEYAATFMDKVNYVGELAGEELIAQYQNALALVYMTQYVEPFGLSVVEAMACGVPVITTGRGGTGETVLNGKTGFFCETKEDILAVLDQVGQLDKDACRQRACHYSVENMTAGYMEAYRGLYA